MNRRGLLARVGGALGTLLGLGRAAAADPPLDISLPDGENWLFRYVDALCKARYSHLQMPPDSTFPIELTAQMHLTGVGLVWRQSNSAGELVEAWVIPTACAFPQPANEKYPRGYYRVWPLDSYPSRDLDRCVAVPAEDVDRIKMPTRGEAEAALRPLGWLRLVGHS